MFTEIDLGPFLTSEEGLVPRLGAVLDPGQVDGAEGVAGDAGSTVVKVLVNVAVEQRVQVHEALGRSKPNGVPHPRVGQPLLGGGGNYL